MLVELNDVHIINNITKLSTKDYDKISKMKRVNYYIIILQKHCTV